MREIYCRANAPSVTRGERAYQKCVELREHGERKNSCLLIALGKIATAAISRIVRIGGAQ